MEVVVVDAVPSGSGFPDQLGVSGRGRELNRRVLRIAAGLGVVLLLMFLAGDLRRSPESQRSAKALLISIDLYQRTLSPHMETAGVRCRFEPTCSHYAEDVIRRDGALEGSWRTLYRLARCGPWTPAGTLDQP